MNLDQELQKLQTEHLRDLENSALRERLRQLYLRSGREIPQSLALRSVDLDKVIAALESGGRDGALDELVRQGLSPLNSWHFLNELLFDSEYPGRGQYYFSHVYGFGAFSDQAAPLLEYDRTYYKNLKNGDEISRHIVEVCADSRAWLLLKAFGEDPKRLCAQELNPTKLCTETLKAAVEDYEFEDLEMAIKLGFKLYFIEGNL